MKKNNTFLKIIEKGKKIKNRIIEKKAKRIELLIMISFLIIKIECRKRVY